jgi:hypothetical protein
VKSDLPYLGHIAVSIAAIESYVAAGRDTFMRERLIQDAAIRNFEISAKPQDNCLPLCEADRALNGPRSSRSVIVSFMAIGASIFCWCRTLWRTRCLV